MNALVPTRGQRKRIKGWTAPQNSLYVGRPTAWGNPWRIVQNGRLSVVSHDPLGAPSRGAVASFGTVEEAAVRTVEEYREYFASQSELWIFGRLRPLFGKVLLCWCPAGQACHVDVLIEHAEAFLAAGNDPAYEFKTWSTGMVAS